MNRSSNRALLIAASALIVATFSHTVILAQETGNPDQPYTTTTLEAFAVLPAETFAEGPASGAAIQTANGIEVPFESQPVQGVSALIPANEGTYYVLSDNGFGAKGNSADYHLRFYEVAVDFEVGEVEIIGFTELTDPNSVIPFPIVNEDTRILTGADFDPESFRRVEDGTFWFGEELGPYLLHTDADGVVLEAPIETPYPEDFAEFTRGLDVVQSPDNPAFVDLADQDARIAAANLPSSRGFEGMALNTSGTLLYPMLEGALFDDTTRTRLLIQEFSLADNAYTGEYFYYPMSNAGNALGDFTAINDREFLVIERDGGQGNDAAFKRIYRVSLDTLGEDGRTLTKTLVADLLAIYDVNGLTTAETGVVGFGPVFKFPFVTIESVYPIDANTLLVVNDNNFPFSSGRRPGVAADNTEFILIGLTEDLNLAQ